MMESSPQHDEMLISLIQQGLDMRQTAGGCDRFRQGGLSWRAIEAELAWVSYDLPNEEMSPDE
jgi:hypothetical protein